MIGFFISVFCLGCRPEYLAFDHHPPGLVPKVFAKDVISKNGEYVGYCAFSPDGSDLYYAETTPDRSTSKIIRISSRNTAKKEILCLKDKRYEWEPFVSRDGKTMYFTVILPPPAGKPWQSDIYRVQNTRTVVVLRRF
jgi:Tol biopolymer transport system component